MTVPAEVAAYVEELAARMARIVQPDAVYVIGSGAYGGFEPGRSDVDVVAVVPRPLPRPEKRALVAAAEAVPSPGRKLELVVYARGADRYDLNLNTGELVSFDPDDEPNQFWFVLDRAIAQEHAVPIVGPPWDEIFAPVPREDVVAALRDSLDYHEREEPTTLNSLLNACRAWRWVESGDWISKPEAARWFRRRVRSMLEEAT